MSLGAPALATGYGTAASARPTWVIRLFALVAFALLFSGVNVGAFLASLATSPSTTSVPLRAATAPDAAPAENAYAADLTAKLTAALAAGSSDATWIAQQRAAAMRTLLEQAPADVEQHLLSPAQIRTARALGADVERTLTVDGRFAQFHEDGARGGHDRYVLQIPGKTWRDTKTFDLFSSDPAAFNPLTSADSVRLTGVAFGNDVLVQKLAKVGAVRTSVFGAQRADAATTVTTGTIKTAVIALQFVDAPAPYNTTQLHNVFQDQAGHNVVDYFKQASYGKAVISPDFYGPFTLPSSMTVAGGQCYDSQALEQAAYQAASAQVTFANYARIFFAITCRTANGLGSGVSLGSVGAIPISTPQGTVTAGQVFAFDLWGYLRISAHELGHNFGLGHAQYYNCHPDAFIPPTRYGLPCETVQYGDASDVMGGQAWLMSNWDLAGDLSADFKNKAGWLGGTNVVTLGTPGTYTQKVAPVETGTASAQAIYIPRGNSGNGFWIDYRQPVGYDSWLTSSTYCSGCNVTQGASVRFAYGNDTNSLLVDTSPYSRSSWDQRDAALTPGMTFKDPEYNITVTAVSADATGVTLSVDIPTSMTCARSAPTVTAANPSVTTSPGVSATYNLTLTNTDSSTCSTNTFRIDPPSGGPGYTVFATPNIVKLAPGASTSVTVTATAPVGSMTDAQSGSFTMTTCGDYPSASCTSSALTFQQVSPSDATAPTVPAGVTATAAGSKQIDVSWSDSTDNSAVVGYQVFRNGVQIATTHAASYTDTSVAAQTAYSYAVAAFDYKNNVSARSGTATATTLAAGDTTAPSAPGNVQFRVNSAHSITVTWAPATDNVGVTRYVISGGSKYAGVPAGTTSFTDDGLAAGTKYTFYVYACDGAGNSTYADPTSTVVYTPKEGTLPPARPAILNHVQVAGTRDDVFFSKAAATGVTYTYFRDNRPVGTVAKPQISDDRYPNDGFAHYDYVQAIDANGNISQSALSYASNLRDLGSATDATAPTVSLTSPAASTTVSGTVVAKASATDNAVVTGAELYVDGELAGASAPASYGTSAALDLPWDTTLWADGSHTLTTKAYDGLGNNVGTSAAVTVTVSNGHVDTTAPSTPTGLTATATGAGQVDLAWSPSTDDTGVASYRVLRDGVQIGTAGTTARWSDTTVAGGTTYSYQVQAVDGSGNTSPASTSASVTTPAATDTSAPAAPTSVVATAPAGDRVSLTWGASSDNVGTTGYYIDRNGTRVATVGTATSWTDSTVVAGTTYSYVVRAFDAAGNVSAASAPASVTTPAASGAVAGVVTAAKTGSAVNGAKVSLTGNGVTMNTTSSSNGSYSFTSVSPGGYTLTVSSKNAKQTKTVTVSSGSTTTLNVVL